MDRNSNIKPLDVIRVDQDIEFTWGGDKHQTLTELIESIAWYERRQRTTELKEIIVLSDCDFYYFKNNLIDYYDFVTGMYDKYTTTQQTLGYIVFNIDSQEMIGIDTQGYNYARYACLVKDNYKADIIAKVTDFYTKG
jgi:hypothetical protein